MKNEHQAASGAQSGESQSFGVGARVRVECPGHGFHGQCGSVREILWHERLVSLDGHHSQIRIDRSKLVNAFGTSEDIGRACVVDETVTAKMRAWLVQFGPVTLREAFHAMDGAEVRAQIDLHYPGGLVAWVADAKGVPDSGDAGAAVDLLGLVDELRSCLEEAHQLEMGNDHCGDGPDGCSYCAAIARAESVLAASSDPEKMPRSMTNAQHFADFGQVALEVLESEQEWNADTLERLSREAFDRGLAYSDGEGMFQRACVSNGGPVVLPPFNGPAGVPSFPVLAFVLDSGGNAVSVECCHSGAHLESIRQNVGNLRLVEVPLALALRAPAMHQALKRSIPWLGKFIADGAHLRAVCPNDAVGALRECEAALAPDVA